MQGLGNDFIIVQGPFAVRPKQIVKYCDRHFGIGADAFIVVSPLESGGLRMQYWNADGSFAEMCGNGLRCAARFAIDNGLAQSGEVMVKTDAGNLKVVYDPANPSNVEAQIGMVNVSSSAVHLYETPFYTASVGNPHAVTFVDDTMSAPVGTLGPRVESDTTFPNKTNVEFVQIMSPNRIRMRVWERGDGETLACGTAMVASAAVAVKFKGVQYPVEVNVPGGSSTLWLDNEGYSRMNGPAEVIFKGKLL